MAHNRRPEHEQTNSSSGVEEGSSSEEGSESESETEQEKPDNSSPPPTPPVPKNPSSSSKKTPTPPSSDESGSDSESDSDSDPPPKKLNKPDPNIKHISSKPMEDTTPKKPRSTKATSPPSSPPPSESSGRGKRPLLESDVRDSKKAKKKENGDDSKKQLFQRLWSEDDEIVILKGMLDYTEKKGADPFADLNDFHNFIKKSLHVDVTKAQLSAKVRRLKQKYENNSIREKKGKVRSFSNPHEKRGYELSKKIWGSASSSGRGSGEGNSAGVQSTVVNETPRKNQSQRISKAVANGLDVQKEVSTVEVEQNVDRSRSVVQLGKIGVVVSEEEIIKDGLELIEAHKRVELEEKWKELKVQEMELYLKRVELIQVQTKLVLDAIKSSDK